MILSRRYLRQVVLAGLGGFCVASSARGGELEQAWKVGKPVALAVQGGRAEFDLTARHQASKTLLIISSLAKQPGPYSVSIAAHPTTAQRPITVTSDGPKRPPVVTVPIANEPVRPTGPPVPETRRFHILVKDGDPLSVGNYQAVEAKLVASAPRVQVYVDADDLQRVKETTVREIVETFEKHVEPLASAEIGPASDVDGDGKFTILVSGWLTKLGGGKHPVDGFVRGTDFDLQMNKPYGNGCDMMYLSAALEPGPYLRTVMAHEYTHAVTFCSKALDASGVRVGAEEEGWLDEALAHLMEDRFRFSRSNLDYRVSAFLSRPEKYRLVVEDYYSENLFRTHGNRGGTYLFLRWCVDTYGEELVGRLIASKRRGVACIEDATGSTFSSLYRRWSIALFMSGLGLNDPELPTLNSIDLREGDEDWMLAGPRTTFLTPGGESDRWESLGTTSHFVMVAGSPTGYSRVVVEGPTSAQLQVTAVPLPDDMARLDVTIKPSISAVDGIRARVRVAERDGTPVRLSALAWEPLVPPPSAHTPGFRRADLDMLGIAASFGTSALPAHGNLSSRPIPLRGAKADLGPLIFKAVGTDAKGRRVAGWVEVDLPVKN